MTIAVAATANADQPNVVYILADDMGYGDVSACNPDSKTLTPNIDRLASEGIRFTDAHTNSSVCTPARCGILTGRYCWRTEKKSGVLHGQSNPLVGPNQETVASFLKDQGYATACIGKWHLGMDWTSNDGQRVNTSNGKSVNFSQTVSNGPLDVGFDYFFGISGSLNMPPHAYFENRTALAKLTWVEGIPAFKARNINGEDGWARSALRVPHGLYGAQGASTRTVCGVLADRHPSRPLFVNSSAAMPQVSHQLANSECQSFARFCGPRIGPSGLYQSSSGAF